jgi:LacI family gluconate utilization system Gnt-I transcriptional repressor
MMMKVSPTLATIAVRVGVSANTVSRALRAPQTVRPEIRKRIEMAMEELNYVPNRLAGGLSGSRSNVVGVIVPSLHNSEFAVIVDTLQSALLEHGLQVMVANTGYDVSQELRLIRSLLSWRPLALTIVGVDHAAKVTELVRASGIPIVETWDTGGTIIDTAVGFDHTAVGAAQATHMIDAGYRNIAFLGSVRDQDKRAQKRLEGAKKAILEAGLPELKVSVAELGGDPDLGESLVLSLLADQPQIDAIICNSDVVAFGVLRGLRKTARAVPGGIGVIGFGDSDAASCLTPSLSSVKPDRALIGKLTADAIVSRINEGAAYTTNVEWRLIARDSSLRL